VSELFFICFGRVACIKMVMILWQHGGCVTGVCWGFNPENENRWSLAKLESGLLDRFGTSRINRFE
jgi:hypothetical protein